MTVREMLTRGDFNDCDRVRQPDGSVLVTLTKRGDPHVYRMYVLHLYQPDERVLREETSGGD